MIHFATLTSHSFNKFNLSNSCTMIQGIWSKNGSYKAQSSQTIRMLLRSLQYLAEDSTKDPGETEKYIKIVVPVIRNLFNPVRTSSAAQQVSTFFETIGWKNALVRIVASNQAEFVLGSNRHLDQSPESIDGLTLLVKAISTAVGYHMLNKNVDALVKISLVTGATYEITVHTISGTAKPVVETKSQTPAEIVRKAAINDASPAPAKVATKTSAPSYTEIESRIDISQLFKPILNPKLSQSTLYRLLQDVLVEFCNSWYSTNPLDGIGEDDPNNNVRILVIFLVNKSMELNRDTKVVGNHIGKFFAQAIEKTFVSQGMPALTPEIIESQTSVIVRDIKARSLCTLQPGDRCVSENRAFCDFGMGIYESVLSMYTENTYKFSTYFAAGRRDLYCLMEFNAEE